MIEIQKALITVGRFDEILIDIARIESVEAVAKLDPAGRPMLPGVRSDYDEPVFAGSVIRTFSGHEHLVPQTVEEILGMMLRTTKLADQSQQ